jgi:tRNA(fMet)-specific endonuclease VapC
MEKDSILVDTNIIIEVLKNNKGIIKHIDSIGIDRVVVSCITVMELYYGALNKVDLRNTKKYLKAFEVIKINHKISKLAIDLIEKYSKGYNLNLPDAFIAATSIVSGLKLYTLNVKDFRYIEGLELWGYEKGDTHQGQPR